MELTPKPDEEIEQLIDGIESVALLACQSCFKEFTSDRSDAARALQEALSAAGKDVKITEDVDFVCLERTTSELLEDLDLDDVDAVATYSCGVGTQVVAGLTEKLVVPLANSEGYRFFEGFYPADSRLCGACGDCVLNETGGICPVAYCSKGLVNGPCGGAQDGKCEIDDSKDCVWLDIYDRLKEQGRLDSMRAGTRIHNRNKPGFAAESEQIETVRQMRDESFPGGVHPLEEKQRTEDIAIAPAPVPDVLVVPLIQHIGEQSEPTVDAGDDVLMGELIGERRGFISAPVHSPVSGKVLSIEKRPHPVISTEVMSVVIENDYQDTPVTNEARQRDIEPLSNEEIVESVRDAGVTGMGGAMFPTHVKLQPESEVDVLILNGCECEPYLTADHRLMVEDAERIIGGMRLVAQVLDVDRSVVAIEENKPDAIETMRTVAGDDVEVVELPTKYPQGAERMLVDAVTGREVPADGLPIDVGVVVSNVGTVAAIHDAVARRQPLIERVVTVTGPSVEQAGNYRVRVGTPFKHLLRNHLPEKPGGGVVIKMGGPMMGIEQSDLDVPVIKGTTGITVLPEPDIEPDAERTCVKCGRCVEVCPMDLKPNRLWYHIKEEDWDKLAELNVNDCIECGACEYICASKLPLVSMIQEAKQKMKKATAEA